MMTTISKKWMQRMALAATSLILATAAQAITFDEALSLLPAEDLAALREAPLPVLDAMSEASQVASAWKAGRLPMEDADLAAADAVARLTAGWSELAMSPLSTRWVAHQVAVAVLATDVKALMVASEWRTDGPLAEAVVGWGGASTRVLTSSVEPQPPSNPCFIRFAACVAFCMEFDGGVMRGLCMLDCEISLVACVGGALAPILGPMQRLPVGTVW